MVEIVAMGLKDGACKLVVWYIEIVKVDFEDTVDFCSLRFPELKDNTTSSPPPSENFVTGDGYPHVFISQGGKVPDGHLNCIVNIDVFDATFLPPGIDNRIHLDFYLSSQYDGKAAFTDESNPDIVADNHYVTAVMGDAPSVQIVPVPSITGIHASSVPASVMLEVQVQRKYAFGTEDGTYHYGATANDEVLECEDKNDNYYGDTKDLNASGGIEPDEQNPHMTEEEEVVGSATLPNLLLFDCEDFDNSYRPQGFPPVPWHASGDDVEAVQSDFVGITVIRADMITYDDGAEILYWDREDANGGYGMIVPVNDNDSDSNGTPDKDQVSPPATPMTVDDPELSRVVLETVPSSDRLDDWSLEYNGFFRIYPEGDDSLFRIWSDKKKTEQYLFYGGYPITYSEFQSGDELFVECTGTANSRMATVRLTTEISQDANDEEQFSEAIEDPANPDERKNGERVVVSSAGVDLRVDSNNDGTVDKVGDSDNGIEDDTDELGKLIAKNEDNDDGEGHALGDYKDPPGTTGEGDLVELVLRYHGDETGLQWKLVFGAKLRVWKGDLRTDPWPTETPEAVPASKELTVYVEGYTSSSSMADEVIELVLLDGSTPEPNDKVQCTVLWIKHFLTSSEDGITREIVHEDMDGHDPEYCITLRNADPIELTLITSPTGSAFKEKVKQYIQFTPSTDSEEGGKWEERIVSTDAWAKREVTATFGATSATMYAYVMGAQFIEFRGGPSSTSFPGNERAYHLDEDMTPGYDPENLAQNNLGVDRPNAGDESVDDETGNFRDKCEIKFKIWPEELVDDVRQGAWSSSKVEFDVWREKRRSTWVRDDGTGDWESIDIEELLAPNDPDRDDAEEKWVNDDADTTNGRAEEDNEPWFSDADETANNKEYEGRYHGYGRDFPAIYEIETGLEGNGYDGIARKLNMREYVKVAIEGTTWRRCSDYFLWHDFRAVAENAQGVWGNAAGWEQEITTGNAWWGNTPGLNELRITTGSPLAAAERGEAYETYIDADDGDTPYAWSLDGGGLPPGLQFEDDGNRGKIHGTVDANAEVGTYTFTLEVQDDDDRVDLGVFQIDVE